MKVSVVIPCYNGKRFLNDAFKSIEAQTLQVDELILVNDGSKDDTGVFLDEYAKKSPLNVRVIHQENAGSGEARNTGIEAAQGEYIAFIDQDDCWLPEKIEKQIKVLDEDKEAVLVFSDGYHVDIDLKPIRQDTILRKRQAYEGFVLNEILQYGCFVPNPTVMVRRSCLPSERPFVQSFFPCDDFDLYLRMAAKGKLRFINEPLINYRLHPDQESRKQLNLAKTNFEVQITRLEDGSLGDDYSKEAARIGNKRLFCGYGKALIREGRYTEACELAQKHLPGDSGVLWWLWWTKLRLGVKSLFKK